MEEKNPIIQQLSLKRITSGLSVLLAGFRSPDMIWRIILSATVGIVVAISGLAIYASRWALSEETLLTIPKKNDALSVEEMHALASFYEEKQKRFDELKRTPPAPPPFGRGVGPVAPKTLQQEEEGVTVNNGKTVSTGTPAESIPEEIPIFTP